MRHLAAFPPSAADPDRFDDCLDLLCLRLPTTRKPTQLRRLEKALRKRLESRFNAAQDDNITLTKSLNVEIRHLRQKIDLCVRGGHIDPVRPKKIP